MPFFGVCVGFQLLYEGSVESPGAAGLGVFPGAVASLPAGVKHPQMQWNTLEAHGPRGARSRCGDWARGPGSTSCTPSRRRSGPRRSRCATTAVTVAALATSRALWGAQFHPEKSGATGLALLANFVRVAREAA